MMRIHIAVGSLGLAALALSIADLLPNDVLAGGFAVREQSAEYQGTSFAGNAAAGGGLSGMFWNPAVAAYVPSGWSVEVVGTGVFGNFEITAGPGTALLGVPGLSSNTGNMLKPAFVPAGYAAYRLSPDTVLALSINSPFGLKTDPANRNWVAQTHNRLSELNNYNITPTLAFRLTPTLSIGAGVQFDQIQSKFQRAVAAVPGAPDVSADQDDTGVGLTAGVNWMPTPQTSVGLGYRSQISHTLKGTISIPGSANPLLATGNAVETDVTLPNMVTLSVRQGITDKFRVLGTVEWTQWSVLQELKSTCPTLGAPFCTSPSHILSIAPENWRDGWIFALGGEYDATRQLKVRVGAAFELSPMQEAKNRTTLDPDQNRLSLSGGWTYGLTDSLKVDFAYSHFWGLGGGVDRGPQSTPPAVRIVGSVQESADIVSVALKMRIP